MTKDDIRKILYKYKIGQMVNEEDSLVLCELLERHPNAKEKIGIGVQGFMVNSGGYGGQCFYVYRTDDTSVDFSFLACFGQKQDDFTKAARYSVESSTQEFRETLPEFFACPINGQGLTRRSCQIDHAPPWTFRAIVKEFRTLNDLKDIEYNHDGLGVSFKDPSLAKRFKDFHDERAQLRGISKKANQSLPKT